MWHPSLAARHGVMHSNVCISRCESMLDKVCVTYVLSGQYVWRNATVVFTYKKCVEISLFAVCVAADRLASPLQHPAAPFVLVHACMVLKPVQPPGFPLQYQPVSRDSGFNM